MTDQFPHELILQYKSTTSKLKKAQKAVFKRFGPNLSEVSEEFSLLALNFENSYLPQYAGLCWLGVAKCERGLGNSLTETEALLKSARAFVAADREDDKLKIQSNYHEHLEGALRCYNQAIAKLDDDSVMKAAIIREIKKIKPNAENLSNFNSPSHRIYDLEVSANESIIANDFVAALEKLTEIYDDIVERKVEDFYEDVLQRNEVSRLLLLLFLELPPSRHSPSHIKLMEKYSWIDDDYNTHVGNSCTNLLSKSPLNPDLILSLQGLVIACQGNDSDSIKTMRNEISKFGCITNEQQKLLANLCDKYDN